MGTSVFGKLKLLPLFCCFADSYRNSAEPGVWIRLLNIYL